MKPVLSIQFIKPVRRIVFALSLFAIALTSVNVKSAYAFSCPLPATIASEHANGISEITQHILDEFADHRDWLTNDFARDNVIPALQLFAEQMSAIAMHQTMTIGMFFDAKHQLESQRLFQELQVQAHKDYQPSTNFCTFGTNVRSLAHTESIGRYNAVFMAQRQLARHLGQQNIAGSISPLNDKASRWVQFVNTYCDPQDNNWTGVANTGLSSVCTAPNSDRVNLDIDYTRLIENHRTLDISRPYDLAAGDEVDVIALGNNLYGHNILFRAVDRDAIVDDQKQQEYYMELRAVAAKRSVAENSFNSIVGMKSLGTGFDTAAFGGGGSAVDTAFFTGTILTELGIPVNEVDLYLGVPDGNYEAFSYYAQLEILAKKIYQNPDFYANLYDKPANVKRIGTALKAIDLMLDRAIYESQLRQEMAMSVLLSSRLRIRFDDINKNLGE